MDLLTTVIDETGPAITLGSISLQSCGYAYVNCGLHDALLDMLENLGKSLFFPY